MGLINSLIHKLDRSRGKARFFVISVAMLGAVLVSSSILAWQSSHEQERIVQANFDTIGVLRAATGVKLAALNAMRGERGFLLTEEAAHLEPYLQGRKNLARRLDDLAALQQDNTHAVHNLRIAAAEYLAMLDKAITLTQRGQRDKAIDLVRQNGTTNDLASIDKLADAIIEKERQSVQLINERAARLNTTLLHLVYLMSAAGLCLLIMAAFSALALSRSFARARDYRDELKKYAETDELTGLANRRQLLTVLEKSISIAREAQAPLSFALLDLDHFKSVNDTYGHATGDRALQHVATAATSMVRKDDLIGRLGGEEFGMILPRATANDAWNICERLRRKLEVEGIVIDGTPMLWTTISVGLTSLQPDDDVSSLMERADKALYAAKSAGRNQVHLAA